MEEIIRKIIYGPAKEKIPTHSWVLIDHASTPYKIRPDKNYFCTTCGCRIFETEMENIYFVLPGRKKPCMREDIKTCNDQIISDIIE